MGAVSYWPKHRYTAQWNRLGIPEINTYVWLINLKEPRIYNGERTISSLNGARKTGQINKYKDIRWLSDTAHKNWLKMN